MNTKVFVKSIIDSDLYKFTMQQAILKLYPNAKVKYKFKNRGKHKFTKEFLHELNAQIDLLCQLSLTEEEANFLSQKKFFDPWYIDFLRSYKFDKSELDIKLSDDGELSIDISGYWYRTILWEVPLMAMISECYFTTIDTDWSMEGQDKKLSNKAAKLMAAGCVYFDFGTRRRRSFEIQNFIVEKMKKHHWFGGTSNPYLAMKHGVEVVGTMAHEWIQGISALESMNHPNRFMLKQWLNVYGTELAIALTDTYGTESFFKDFDKELASLYLGVRHDSADPFQFTDKVINHYKKLGIDYSTKIIVFSNALNDDLAAEIQKYCKQVNIICKFGIGTAFTNDFDSDALNMVIKLCEVNGFFVVKLSDDVGKNNGDESMVAIMKSIHMPNS